MTRAANLSRDLEKLGPFDPDAMTYREARRIARAFYRANDRADAPNRILTATAKMQHSQGVVVGINLRPGDGSGVEVCTMRTMGADGTGGCTAVCVIEESPRGRWGNVRSGRDLKTLFLQAEPQAFVTIVAHELRALVRQHGAVSFRPNVASDLRWEFIAPALFGIAGVRGFDYTKWNPLRQRGNLANYRLCYSVSEHPLSESIAAAYVNSGGTAAVVVRVPKHDIPQTWAGMPTVDGDATDDRTTDPQGVYVILAEKINGRADGKLHAESDRSGFVKTLPLQVAS